MRNLTLLLALVCPAGAGCTQIAINTAANALVGGGGAFASDDDPEFVRDAAPFGLKTTESLIEASPRHPKLLLAATTGFTEYGYAFLQQDADRLEEANPEQSRHLLARARKMYARARRYGMRGLDALDEGFAVRFEKDRKESVKELDAGAVPLLYWTAAAWAAEISISKDNATLLGEMPQMETLMARALELDEAFEAGAIHEFYVSYDGGRPEASGGSVKRAQQHFDRAIALGHGKKVGPYLSWAENVCVQQQDKKKFLELVEKVLAFDPNEAPEFRLVNLITQDRARRLKARVDDLFAE